MKWFSRRTAADTTRWVVLDVESSGLDPASDRLLAVAAVALRIDWPARRMALVPADSFEVVLRQAQASSRANILLHGIGVQRQAQGVPAAEAAARFAAYAATAPRLAFHAAFDRKLLARHGLGAEVPWADIEHLCAATHPEVAARSLDDWLAHFGIGCAQRHEAAADTWAECELLLRIWPRIAAQCGSWRDVERLAAAHRWLPRAGGRP